MLKLRKAVALALIVHLLFVALLKKDNDTNDSFGYQPPVLNASSQKYVFLSQKTNMFIFRKS